MPAAERVIAAAVADVPLPWTDVYGFWVNAVLAAATVAGLFFAWYQVLGARKRENRERQDRLAAQAQTVWTTAEVLKVEPGNDWVISWRILNNSEQLITVESLHLGFGRTRSKSFVEAGRAILPATATDQPDRRLGNWPLVSADEASTLKSARIELTLVFLDAQGNKWLRVGRCEVRRYDEDESM